VKPHSPGQPHCTPSRRSLAACTALAALATIGGCALPSAAPKLDAELGLATRQALAQQVLRPEAGREPSTASAPSTSFDGVSAVNALTRHREGFKAPPSSFSVLGIGASGNP
jgi:hypothetical protein